MSADRDWVRKKETTNNTNHANRGVTVVLLSFVLFGSRSIMATPLSPWRGWGTRLYVVAQAVRARVFNVAQADSASARVRSSCAPSPRHALPCMHARVVGC